MFELNSSAIADGVWLLALLAMALRSLEAWRALPEGAPVPLQWTLRGEPAMWASRELAVSFTPIIGLVGGLLLASAERGAADAAPPELLALRFLAPVLLTLAHHWHLRGAVETVKA